MTRKLTRFEDNITGIALKLVKEIIDPQDAGMAILDLVNDEIEIDAIRERAGFDKSNPWGTAFLVLKRALPDSILRTLYEVSPDELKVHMARAADDWLKQHDSDLEGATTTPPTEEPYADPEPTTDLGRYARDLKNIARTLSSEGELDRHGIQRLIRIARELEKYEQEAGKGIGRRFKRIFGSRSMEDEEIRSILVRAGLIEQEERNLGALLRTQKLVIGPIIKELRDIARFLQDKPKEKERLNKIADQLADMQWKLHGEKERETGQLWKDVERQEPAY